MLIDSTTTRSLIKLKRKGLSLDFDCEDKLRVSAKKGSLTTLDKDYLKSNKPNILKWFTEIRKSIHIDSSTATVSLDDVDLLTANQQALWNANIMSDDPSSLNMVMDFVLTVDDSKFSSEKIKISLNNVLSFHTALRLKFLETTDSEVLQIASPLPPKVLEVKFSSDEGVTAESVIKNHSDHKFDLESGDLPIKVTLINFGKGSYRLVIVAHHIVCDGWSINLLLKQFVDSLNDNNSDAAESDFVRIVAANQSEIKDNAYKEVDQKIIEKIATLPLIHNIPTDKPREDFFSGRGGVYTHKFSKTTTDSVLDSAQRNDATPFSVVHAALNAYLCKLSGQSSFALGMPLLNRNGGSDMSAVGYFSNTSFTVEKYHPEKTFDDHVKQSHNGISYCLSHQSYPFERALKVSKRERDPSYSPMFQVMTVFQTSSADNLENMEGFHIERVESEELSVKYDLTFSFAIECGQLIVSVEYASALFNIESIEKIVSDLETLLPTLCSDSGQKINHHFSLISPKMIDSCSKNIIKIDSNISVIDMLRDVAGGSPSKVAVSDKDNCFTYKDLIHNSEKIARHLIKECSGKKVGVYIENGALAVVSILGIMMAGKAYVPIDSSYPDSRVDYIMKNSGTEYFLTDVEGKSFESVSVIKINDIINSKTSLLKDIALEPILPDNLAYVIYTSGSTGNPKGVKITHRNLMQSTNARFSYYDDTVEGFLLLSSLAFDSSVAGLYWTLLSGGHIYIPSVEEKQDINALSNVIRENRISHLLCVPSLYRALISEIPRDNVPSLKVTICAGETLPVELSKRHKKWQSNLSCKLFNEYGPTESTVWSSVYKCTGDEEYIVPIGRSSQHVSLALVGEDLEPVIHGAVGELLIFGENISSGYLNNKELTDKKFIYHETYGRVYKTGDLVRLDESGNICFVGRKDQEIKINGYRVNLTEIETVVRKFPHVKDVTVLSKGANLYCAVETDVVKSESIRKVIEEELPSYMHPKFISCIEKFPKTPNGKIDANRIIKDLQINNDNKNGAGNDFDLNNCSDAEKSLLFIWRELLSNDVLTVYDDFLKIGGDSVIAIQIAARAKKAGINISAKDVFKSRTINALSLLHEQNGKSQKQDTPEFVDNVHNLHPMQDLFLNDDNSEKNHYNQSLLLEVDYALNKKTLIRIARYLSLKHPSLQMSFKYKGNNAWEASYNSDHDYLDNIEWIGDSESKSDITQACKNAQKSMSINEGKVFKIVSASSENVNYFFIAAHHLVVDAVSWRVILSDIAELVKDSKLKTPKVTDWGYRLSCEHIALNPEPLSDSLRLRIDSEISRSKIPTDSKITEATVGSRKISKLRISAKDFGKFCDDKNISSILGKAASMIGMSTEEVLVSAVNMAIKSSFNLTDVVIDMEHHGRGKTPFSDDESVGWFTHTFPVYFSFRSSDGGVEKILVETKESLRSKSYSKNSYYWHPDSKYKHSDVIFNFFGDLRNTEVSQDFSISELSKGDDESPLRKLTHKLAVTGMIVEDSLVLSVSYSEDIFNTSTITSFTEELEKSLFTIVHECLKRDSVKRTPSDFKYALIEDVEFLEEMESHLENIVEIYPTTPLQKGMLHHSSTKDGDYITQMVIDIEGRLNESLLKESWINLVDSTPTLRTAFHSSFGYQIVTRNGRDSWNRVDLTDLNKDNQERKLSSICREIQLDGFNLNQPTLSNMTLIKLSSENYKIIWSSHHALIDGWSASMLLKNLFDTYNSLSKNIPVIKASMPDYGNYINYLHNQDKEREEQYWKSAFSLSPEGCIPQFSNNQVLNKNALFRKKELIFSSSETSRIVNFARDLGVTLNTLIHATWGHILHNYTGSDTVVFGEVSSGRPESVDGIESMIGMFINTIPVVINKVEGSLYDYFHQVQHNATERRDFEATPLSTISRITGNEGKELFHSLIVFESYPGIGCDDDSSDISPSIERVIDKTTLPLTITVKPGELLGIEFDFFDDNSGNLERTESFMRLLRCLLMEALGRPDMKVSEWTRFDGRDIGKEIAFAQSKRSENHYTKNSITLHEAFMENAYKEPESIAVIDGENYYTYREIDKISNRIANRLMDLGVNPSDKVALYLPRTFHMITGILGVIKAGAIYIPLDMQYPKDRIDYILNDAKGKAILSLSGSKLPLQNTDIINLNLDDDDLLGFDEKLQRDTSHDFDSDAYLIYTSGSTGNPKGVLNSHKSIMFYYAGVNKVYRTSAKDKVLQFSSISFDIFVEEMTMALVSCGTLVIDKNINRSAEDFWRVVMNNDVSVISLPTAFFHYICSEHENIDTTRLMNLRVAIVGGEALSVNSVKVWQELFDKKVQLLNVYGPTEATVVASYFDATNYNEYSRPVPIGYPFDNYDLYVMDESGVVLPEGIDGELCIGGECLATGYHNKLEVTKERFVTTIIQGKEERVYRTGDIVKRLPDGALAYLGRNDDQVKVRGYRIEIGEIESLISNLDIVNSVFVMPFDNNTAIAAYIVMNEKAKLSGIEPKTVVAEIKGKLPSYMVPSSVMLIESLPMTANGKVDKKSLPDPILINEDAMTFVAPQSEVEIVVAKVWESLLSRPRVGLDDNFFDLGGSSLRVAKLKSSLETEAGIRLDYADLFLRPTVRLQADLVGKKLSKDGQDELAIVTHDTDSPLGSVYCFPGLGAFAHEFGKCVKTIDDKLRVVAFNPDIKNVECLTFTKAVNHYADIIERSDLNRNVLIGHSFGCVMAMAVGQELDSRGIGVKVILLDYFYGELLPKLSESGLRSMVEADSDVDSDATKMAASRDASILYELIRRQDAWMMTFKPSFNLQENVVAAYTDEAISHYGLDKLSSHLSCSGDGYEVVNIGKDHFTVLNGDEFQPVNDIINKYIKGV